jgi:DNA-3-methyladenine glycosylase II
MPPSPRARRPAPDWSPALRHLAEADPALAPVIDRHGPPSFVPTPDPLASLGRAIVYQQLSGKAAATIYGRFLDLYPGKRFPRAPALLATAPEALRKAGMSAGKAASLLDLAAHVNDGRLRPGRLWDQTDEAVAAALLPVRGIGPWSVDMFLMFALCRPDVLPVGDLGVRKGMQKHFRLRKLPEADRMRQLARAWAPFRSVAAWYMWRVLE